MNRNNLKISEETITNNNVLMNPEQSEEVQNAISNGLYDTEMSLFGQCNVIRERTENISHVLQQIEQRMLIPNFISKFSDAQLVFFYKLMHEVNQDLRESAENIHKLVSDERKFERIMAMQSERINTNRRDDELDSKKVRQILGTITNLLKERSGDDQLIRRTK